MSERSWFERRMAAAVLLAAMFAGIALAIGFVRFNALHREFLSANFDSVHGARTLLKARHFIALAEERLERAGGSEPQRHLPRAAEALALAENYSGEGNDADPLPRRQLTARLRELRRQVASSAAPTPAELAALAGQTKQLAADFEAAELDRWGMLSSLNGELAARMGELRVLIGILLGGLAVVLALLGRALLVTRRTEAKLRLAKSEIEAMQQTTLDASPIGIVYVDGTNLLRCRVVKANRQMSEFLAAPLDKIVGRAVHDLVADGADIAHVGPGIAARLAAGEVVQHEFRVRRSGGATFWCGFAGKAIDPAEPGRGVVWTLEDVDERKRSESRLREAREQAEAASRAKSEFLANMSHEIRTPFTAILGVLDTLLRSPLDAQQQYFARLGQSSARQLLAIVNDILDISKIEAGKLAITPTAIDLYVVVDEVAAAHAATATAKGIGFAQRRGGSEPPMLQADGVRLRQVIDNLLSNAVKFTPHGGVTLAVDAAPADPAGWFVRIEVADTGIGVAPELHELIFEKFAQGDSSTTRLFGGTGLGLAICRQLVLQMGGHIGLKSEPGQGSTFWIEFTFPAAPGGEAVRRARPVPADGSAAPPLRRLDGLRIVLAEDSAANAAVLGAQIASTGAELRLAANGIEAVALVRQWRPDVLLLDCQMPELDGYATARRIRAGDDAASRTPILALTAHASNENRERCLASGMDDFLGKPFDLPVLLEKIAGLCGARSRKPPPAPPERFDGRILLVDDNALVREASRGMLESFGLQVSVADSGQQALEHCERDDLDLVLLDCRMPGLDGFATASTWRRRENGRRRTAIVAVSAELDVAGTARYHAAGMDDFLAKPYNLENLATLLQRWLGPAA